jgi:bifunctional UDP-N-acetylglucosamine pyrophosphorylase/glucosamine-1-phosphate N-acetyltransferase
MTVKLKDFLDWRNNFYHWGRLVRDFEGNLEKIVEYKDAADEQRKITEVNPAIFCFKSQWLWENIYKLKNKNKQEEYYLTDLIKLAFKDKQKIESVSISAQEGAGINSREELNVISKIIFN